MTPRKTSKQKTQSLWQIAKNYVARFAAHRELVKRALFKWPKRILKDTDAKLHIVDTLKSIFWHMSGSVWLLIASGVFLLYAAWSAFGPKTISTIALHPASNIPQDTVVTPTPVMSAPRISNDTIAPETEEPATTPLVEPSTPVLPDTLQHIYAMYAAINDGSYIPANYFDSYMQTSDLVTMYFTSKRLTTLRASVNGNIQVVSAEEFATDRNDRIGVRYTLNYKLINNDTTFTETRSVTLRPQAWGWRIGTVRCETRWCSVNPFFNIEKYGIK